MGGAVTRPLTFPLLVWLEEGKFFPTQSANFEMDKPQQLHICTKQAANQYTN